MTAPVAMLSLSLLVRAATELFRSPRREVNGGEVHCIGVDGTFCAVSSVSAAGGAVNCLPAVSSSKSPLKPESTTARTVDDQPKPTTEVRLVPASARPTIPQ